MMIVCAGLHAIAQKNLLWNKSYGGSAAENWSVIVDLPGHNVIVGTNTVSTDKYINNNHGKNDVWLTKISGDGDTLWTRSYGGSKSESSYGMILTTSGTVVCAGHSASKNSGDVGANKGSYDAWVFEVDTIDGSLNWSKTYGSSGYDYGYSLQENSRQEYVVAGICGAANGDIDSGRGGFDGFVFVVDKNGNLLRNRSLGGTISDNFNDLVVMPDGSYVLVGETNSKNFEAPVNKGGRDIWIVKVDTSLNVVWTKTFGGSGYDNALGAILAPDGNILIHAYSDSKDGDLLSNPKADSMGASCLLKVTTTGNVIWQKAYGGTDYEYPADIELRGDNEILLISESASSDGDVPANKGQADTWLCIVDSVGDVKFSQNYGGSKGDYANKIVVDEYGDIYISSLSRSSDLDVDSNYGSNDLWLIKLCGSPDTMINGNMFTYTANHNFSGASYQWLDCSDNSVLSTSKSYTVTKNGSYKLVVSTGCGADTSACFAVTSIGISTITKLNDVGLYPNPAHDVLHLSSKNSLKKATATVYDINGRVVLTEKISNGSIRISSLPDGVFTCVIVDIDGQMLGRKVFVKR